MVFRALAVALILMTCPFATTHLLAAETLDKDKFLAPSTAAKTQSSDPLAVKSVKDLNSVRTSAATPAGHRAYETPVNGMCSSDSYCVSTHGGSTLKCYPWAGAVPVQNYNDCTMRTRFCADIEKKLAAGETLEGGQLGYYKYCVE